MPHKRLIVLVDSARVRLAAMGKVLCIIGGRINAWIKASKLMIDKHIRHNGRRSNRKESLSMTWPFTQLGSSKVGSCTLTQEFLRDKVEEEQRFNRDLWLSKHCTKNNMSLADHDERKQFRAVEFIS